MPRGRPRKKKEPATTEEVVTKTDKTLEDIYDFKIELPGTVMLKSCDLYKVIGYVYETKGRFWKDGEELVCVRLLEKYK